MVDKGLYGAPEEIRTPDPQIRSLVLSGAIRPSLKAKLTERHGRCQ